MSEKINLTILKKHRLELDITQESLAEMVGVTTRTIQRIESGNPTSLSTAQAISSVLQLPSYHVLTDAYERQQQPQHEKAHRWCESVKDALFTHKDTLLLQFIAIVALCAMMPVENLSVLALYAILPACTLIVATMEKRKTKEEATRSVSLTSWIGIITCFVLAQLTATSFFALSFMQTPSMLETTSEFAALTYMPGVDTFSQTWTEHMPLIWRAMGVLSLMGLYGIYFFANNAKRNGERFGAFPMVFLATSLVVAVVGEIMGYTAFFSVTQTEVALAYAAPLLITWLASYFITRTLFKKHKENLHYLKVSILTAWLTTVFAIGLFSHVNEQQTHLLTLENDYDYRNQYCQASAHKLDICWGPALIEKYNLPMTPQNTALLDALNGQMKALHWSLNSIAIPADYPLDGKPFPAAFYQLYSRAYAAVLSHSNDLAFLAKQHNKEGVYYTSYAPKDTLDWSLKAKSDFQGFVETFQDAPKSVQHDVILSMFYQTFSGQWQKRMHKSGETTYSIHGIYVPIKDGHVRYHSSKRTSFGQLEKILAIPETAFPNSND
jgi:DNA-binding XRE family transcriptional regulator